MTGYKVAVKGFRLDKHGRLIRYQRRLSVSQRLKQQSRNSKRVRVISRRKTRP